MSLRLEYSTTAKATPAQLWEKFAKVEEWAWWNPVFAQAKWESGAPWKKGSRLRMEFARPMTLKVVAEVIAADAPHRVAWVGKAKGTRGEHWFSFESQVDGPTTVKTWEDFSGITSVFIGAGKKKQIVQMYETWLTRLKEEAEKIAREQLARS